MKRTGKSTKTIAGKPKHDTDLLATVGNGTNGTNGTNGMQLMVVSLFPYFLFSM